MPSQRESRTERLAELERRILAQSTEAVDSLAELSERSMRSHQAIVRGDFGSEPTQLRMRLHGEGVKGHQVAADQAGALLRQTQLAVRWIGARLRTLGDEKQLEAKAGDRMGIAAATRLFIQPQFGAGSLIFELVGEERPPDGAQAAIAEPVALDDTLLDRSVQQLIAIIASSEADTPESLGALSGQVARMGPRVASQLKRLAEHVTDDEINIDLRWRGSAGRTRSANLGRRGALAIKDAVERNRVKEDEIVLTGLLETVSTGKDQVRIDTPNETFKMDVDEALGVTLGGLLHREVTARLARRIVWHQTGKETTSYRLLAVEVEGELGDHEAESTSV
jgi:hypothetical protein